MDMQVRFLEEAMRRRAVVAAGSRNSTNRAMRERTLLLITSWRGVGRMAQILRTLAGPRAPALLPSWMIFVTERRRSQRFCASIMRVRRNDARALERGAWCARIRDQRATQCSRWNVRPVSSAYPLSFGPSPPARTEFFIRGL